MKKITNIIADAFPFIAVAILLWMAIAQFTQAQRELEQSRSECYAQVGKEACESVR